MNLRIKWLIRNILRVAVPMLIPIIMLGAYSLVVVQRELNTEIREKNIQLLKQTNQSIESIFGTVDMIGANFDTNAKDQHLLKTILNQSNTTTFDKDIYNTTTNFLGMLRSYQNSNPYIHSIFLFVNNPFRNVLSSNDSVVNSVQDQNKAWIDSYWLMKPSQTHLIAQRNLLEYPFESGNVSCITISREIQNTFYSGVKAGVVVINFRENMIQDKLKADISTPDSALLLAGSDGSFTIIASDIEGLSADAVPLGSFPDTGVTNWIYGNSRYICFTDTSNVFDLKLAYIMPTKVFYQPSSNILNITIVLLVFSLVIGSGFSYYFAHKTYVSLSTILATIRAAEDNKPLPVALKHPKDEYDYLLQNMINVFIKQSAMRMQNAEEKYELKNLELLALQDQINPHFLNNTLRTVFWKTIGLTVTPNDTSKMIEYLIDLLGFVFGMRGYRVSLKQEMLYANSYLNIQRIRYNEKFIVVWQYDTDLENAAVIKLILQPILENCILHGFANSTKKHYGIRISIYKKEDRLYIRITDNGQGMNQERLKQVREEMENNRESGRHIGLSNVKKRLEVFYKQENIDFDIHSKPMFGTSVRLAFPYEEFKLKDASGEESESI